MRRAPSSTTPPDVSSLVESEVLTTVGEINARPGH
jgi:hypothetical protein